jgi:hypothetical protein
MDDVAARAQAVRAEVVNEAASAAVREQAEAIVQRADAAIEATHAAETDGARPDLPARDLAAAARARAPDNDLDARLYRIAVAKGIMKGLPPELTARADSLRETPDGLLFEVSTTGGRMGVAIEGEGDGTRVVLDVKRAKLDGTRKVGGRLVTGCAAEQSVGEEILRVAASYGVEHGRIERDEGPRAARQHATRVQEAGRR